MKRITLFFLILTSLGQLSFAVSQDEQIKPPWDGNRATPVHQIPLKDEFDQIVIPTESYPLPFSSRYTCEPCHDYTIIQQGLHFNMNSATPNDRTGEPWIWVDPKTGTILPLSYRNWENIWNPRDLGLTPWKFSLLFGRHMLGGGVNEPEDDEVGPDSRWDVSGKIEINCMGCHNASRMQSHSEWAKQILRHNFRWAATAASGLGEVKGMASRLPGTWDIFDGPNPDDTEWAVVPSVQYNSGSFDSKHRVFFDISYKPDDQRCLACHSVSQVQVKKFTTDADVHTRAGLKCVDCHRNDLSHNMIRGNEGEAEELQNPEIADFSCKGCHLGNEMANEVGTISGRLGAPYPRHRGIPAVHFERLSCTVCHAGPLPDKEFTRVRTSRANRLGIYGIAQWFTEMPHIIEPVFIRDESGKITPHRLMWPAFWGRLEGEKIIPLKPSDILAASEGILDAEESIARILIALSMDPEIEGVPVLVSSEKVFTLNVDGELETAPLADKELDKEILWALKKEDQLFPLVPDFDPNAEEQDADIETQIQNTLEALASISDAPGKPVMLYKEAMYQIVDGYLEKRDWKEESVTAPRFCWWDDIQIKPLVSEFHMRTILATIGLEQTLTEEQVEMMLKSLASAEDTPEAGPSSQFFYVSCGKLFQIDKTGKLKATEHEAADPITWPLGHQIRPARQSLGIKGCIECHKAKSAFFFNKVEGVGPLKTQQKAVHSNISFMGMDKPYQKLFGLSFTIRPLFKIILFVSALLIASLLLIVFLLALGRSSGLIEKGR